MTIAVHEDPVRPDNYSPVSYNPLIPSNHELNVFQTMAKQAANSKLYRGIGDEFAVMTIMLAARELNIPPMAALNGGINIINGKTEIASRMMGAMILRAGHDFITEKSTDEECIMTGKRKTGKTETVSFHIEEAKRAGLIKEGGGWKKWPKDMCYARAMSRLARRLFQDVIGMGYVEGEIGEVRMEVRETEVLPASFGSSEVVTLVENSTVTEQEAEDAFISGMAPENRIDWSIYIQELKKKLNLKIWDIIKRYESDPIKTVEKFDKWKSLRKL